MTTQAFIVDLEDWFCSHNLAAPVEVWDVLQSRNRAECITGLAQVSLGYTRDSIGEGRKLRLDLAYVRSASWRVDGRIFRASIRQGLTDGPLAAYLLEPRSQAEKRQRRTTSR